MNGQGHRSSTRDANKDDDDNTYALTPPPGEFRIVKNLYRTEAKAEWLCLPRHLDTTPALEDLATEHDVAPTPETHQQAPEWKQELSSDSQVAVPQFEDISRVAEPTRGSNIDFLTDDEHHRARAQLVVVKMHDSTTALRHEFDILELLHDNEGSEAFIGVWVSRSLHAYSAATSWLSLRPIFGKTLVAFGNACLESSRVPTYFVWHIFLGLMSALEFVHGADVTHGAVSSANAMLRYSTQGRQQYRDWPDVVLTGFEAADKLGGSEDKKSEDLKDLASVMYQDVIMWGSDSAVLIRFLDPSQPQTDLLIQFAAALAALTKAPHGGSILNLGTFDKWKGIAVAEREKGPESCPDWIQIAAHDVLATEEELEKAMRPPLVLNFRAKLDKFKKWDRATRTPVALRKRETKRRGTTECGLLVIKFKLRKKEFADLVGSN